MLERHLACLSPSGFHRVVYDEWPGPPGAPTLVCLHGLSRNSRDFDALAQAMARTHRVVCPDMAGRGRSEWLKNPAEYLFPTYLADCAALIARLDVDSVDWVGTSMGALIGMMLAAQKDTPVRRLALNDAGAVVMKEGLNRIGLYLGSGATFDSIGDMEAAVRRNNAPYGPLSDAEWRKLTVDSARERPDGRWGFNYDPHLGDLYKAGPVGDVDLWAVYDAVRCPTLLLRGEHSDVLSHEVAAAMTGRGPQAKLVEFAGIGHAPQLLSADQIGVVRDFLAG
ncbi:pimeloyl-ACP methyl ester carboxylesterase [Roseiarcus fermentans]|uniref:Pimeloyl-ACP methyl ester carboxylesterase n=1 Tax=Roseiarcus fermentans TaxID=1473586 RepID=A0A366F3E8_9HYPH|nr:alpha/beta fold hydrolase [Roseiarcus fermentans]RBP09183.1 pimeloyl-ACP methyl ester carboxylesterase [Roseiarcus fermentans]